MASLGIRQFSDMVTDVGTLVQDTSTSRQTEIKWALNNALMLATRLREWDELLTVDESGLRMTDDSTLTTLINGQAEAPMPWNATRIKHMQFQTELYDAIRVVEAADLYREAGTQLTQSGRPRIACVIGTTAQHTKLAASEILKMRCATSANANKVVRVHYQPGTANLGNFMWEDVTTSDWTVSKVMSVAAAAGWPVRRVRMPSGWTDHLSIYRNDGTTEIASIERIEIPATTSNSTENTASRLLLRFWPVPDADLKLTIAYWAQPQRLTEDEDTPPIPVSDFMVFKAAATIMRQMGEFNSAQQYESEARTSFEAASTGGTLLQRATARPLTGGIMGMTGVRPRGR